MKPIYNSIKKENIIVNNSVCFTLSFYNDTLIFKTAITMNIHY